MNAGAGGNLQGIAFMLLAAAFFAATHTAIRHVAADVHPFEIAFFRNAFALVLLAPLLVRGRFALLRTGRPGLHVVRGLLNGGFMATFFLSLSLSPVAVVTALNFTAPLFATLLAIVVLGEAVGPRRWAALLVGFAGTLVIVRPGAETLSAGALLALVASLFWGGTTIAVRMLSRTEASVTIAAYMAVVLTPVMLLAALPFWRWPDPPQLAWLAAIAALATVAQTALAEAFRRAADASAVLPFEFTRLIWAAALGFVAFGEVPSAWVWPGGAVILASATYIARREARAPRRLPG